MAETKISDQTIVRRSANYQPSIWGYGFIQSLKSDYVGESYRRRIQELKEQVRMMLEKAENDHVDQLEIIDTLQRLGLAYHFEDEINRALKAIFNDKHCDEETRINKDLHATSLEFRLLRQHGYNVHQEVFNRFMDERGKVKAWLCDDLKGMLYLYEASYFLVEGESILEDARDFTTKELEKYVKQSKGGYLSMLVSHALELPLNWRMLRLEASWFIHAYESKQDMKPTLLELAKLDFNMVQATHQEDLKHVSRWWSYTGFSQKLGFARDRVMANFLWAVGTIFEPQLAYCRRMLTKLGLLLTVVDDIYDVYATLDELELFTDAIVRWDINAADQLPDYMKIFFLALYNSIHEIAFDILRDKGFHVIPYLKKVWADVCKSYLLEAKWYYSEYTPALQEYLDNAWISISIPILLVHLYFMVTIPITKETSQYVVEYPNIVQSSAMITRLADDLGTSSDELKRGDIPKSIQCYMHETGASEEEAREYIHHLISETWKKMNQNGAEKGLFSKTFKGIAMNLARSAQCMYQHGDGHGARQEFETKDYAISLFIQPIQEVSTSDIA